MSLLSNKQKAKHLNLKAKRPGQILIISLIFLLISIILIAVFLSQTTNFISFFGRGIASESAKQLAESGFNYAISVMNSTNKPTTFPYSYTLQPANWPGEIKFTIEDIGSAKYRITSSGYIPNSTNPRGKRTVSAVIGETGAPFPNLAYAVQVGSGGISMGNLSEINSSSGPGNVYSDGQIVCAGIASIPGIVYALSFVIDSSCPTTYGTKYSGAAPLGLPPDNASTIINSIPPENQTTCSPTCIIPNNNPDSPILIGNQTYNGNLQIDCTKTFVGQNCVQVNGPIHVTGNLTLTSNQSLSIYAKLQVHSSVINGVAIVVDGLTSIGAYTNIGPNYDVNPYSDLMIISRKSDSGFAPYAIEIASYATAKAIFVANNGTVKVNTGAGSLRQVTAKKLILGGNSTSITYDIGLASELFGLAPGGGVNYQIQKGSFQSVATPED